MNKELILAKQDLENAGFNANLNTNDLIEVIASEIFDGYIEAVNDMTKRANEIQKEYDDLMAPEFKTMYADLKAELRGEMESSGYDDDDSDVGAKGVTGSFSTADEYWPCISMYEIYLKDTEKGTGQMVSKHTRSFCIPDLKKRTAKVKLALKYKQEIEKILKIGDIQGTSSTTINKSFKRLVTVPLGRFKEFQKKVAKYNEDAVTLKDFLPKGGVLSLERFTREARVKMNKKIISGQSGEFREKMSQLFNIKL